MKANITKIVQEGIREKVGLQPEEEWFGVEYTVIKSATATVDGRKLQLTPLSFGYEGDSLSAPVVKMETVMPHIALENFEGKILYLKNIPDMGMFRYIEEASPLAVITNTEFKKPIFSPKFPIFYLHSFLSGENLKISVKIKKQTRKGKNFFFDIGIGGRILLIHFPFDSRFSQPDSLSFHGSFQATLHLAQKLNRVKHPRGFRIRFLFSDMYLSRYAGLGEHLKAVGKERVLFVFNMENVGVGNEKLVLKERRNLLGRKLFSRISFLLHRIGREVATDSLKDYSGIDGLPVQVVWFNSQPNQFLYHLKKDFLNGKLITGFVNTAFYLINNVYKEGR
ncbi:MAG: hypothetical protein GXN94_00615 [Aquificae bacterium]|nr:hypothetical protein [Aquificota bacterium]